LVGVLKPDVVQLGNGEETVAATANLDSAVRKVTKRILSFLFILYIISFLDRINIGFAALAMNKDLQLSAAAFGFANTIFYIGYFIFEIPSNIALARVGARVWLARIMITWGIFSTATALAVGADSLYVLRFLVGVAEAGFLPGALLYMTYWFPTSHRARANGIFMVAQPVTSAFGAIISGFILQMNGFLGVAGWRWLFVIEGVPAVILGVITYFYLVDRPRAAQWLSAGERNVLEAAIKPKRADEHRWRGSAWREVLQPSVLLLAAAYFCLVTSLNMNGTWLPQLVRMILPEGSFISTGLLTAVPFLFVIVAMPLWGRRSDRRGERIWHTMLPMGVAAAGWTLFVLTETTELRMTALILSQIGSFLAMAVFWTVPASLLSNIARPVGFALISTVGLSAAAVTPMVIGLLRDKTGNFSAGLFYVVAMLGVGAIFVWAASRIAGRSVD
jgi:ACS family 4-hydroxyphenylacetate permease-like MFS transporter